MDKCWRYAVLIVGILAGVGIYLTQSVFPSYGMTGKAASAMSWISITLDPSPYLGLPLNAKTSDGGVIACQGPGQ